RESHPFTAMRCSFSNCSTPNRAALHRPGKENQRIPTHSLTNLVRHSVAMPIYQLCWHWKTYKPTAKNELASFRADVLSLVGSAGTPALGGKKASVVQQSA